MVANTPASRKAKGRLHQQWFRDLILKTFPHLEPDDVKSTSMGASGEDILLSPLARRSFPYSIECKAVESLNVWAAYAQAEANSKGHSAVLVMKKSRKRPLIVLDAETFMELLNAVQDDPRRPAVAIPDQKPKRAKEVAPKALQLRDRRKPSKDTGE